MNGLSSSWGHVKSGVVRQGSVLCPALSLLGLGAIVGLGPPVLAAQLRILAKPSCPVEDVAFSR